MRDLVWLSDETWAALEPHLPKNQPGNWRRIATRYDRLAETYLVAIALVAAVTQWVE